MEDNNNPKKRVNKPNSYVGSKCQMNKMEQKYIQNKIQSPIKQTEVIKKKNIKKQYQTQVIQGENKKPNPFYNKVNYENPKAKSKTQLPAHMHNSKKQKIEKNQPKNEIISDNVANVAGNISESTSTNYEPINPNISESTNTNYEPINDSDKKYNTGIKSNINKINIKEQKNDKYIPYSTILKIESGIDLSHDKLGQK